jgi:hypothetical protein
LKTCKYIKGYSSKQTLKLSKRGLLFVFCCWTFLSSRAQLNVDTTYRFIAKHQHLALEQFYEYGIPASITLAQAIYESGSGTSYLAKFGNNFFGIKCHREWGGDSLIKDDEQRNECFRSYASVKQCFEDRSLFLKSRSRYHFLFKIPANDYKAWCNGLQEAGYATYKKYATILIYIIEKYKLFNLEQADCLSQKKFSFLSEINALPDLKETLFIPISSASIIQNNKTDALVKAIVQKNHHIASKGQTISDISQLYGLDVRLLCSNNNISQKAVFNGGEVLFLTKKKPFKYELPVNQ